jgi:regulator of sigma E protease
MLISALTVKIIVGLVVLGVLVFVHELGHFIFAKLCKVGVLEFSIGFGKKLWAKRIGETRYAVRLIPLGGYVRMAGDDPREVYGLGSSEEKDKKKFTLEPVEEVTDELERKILADKSKWFLEKGVLAKVAIVLAGPGFNLLFGWILSIAVFFFYGASDLVDQPIIGEVLSGHPAEKAGIQSGDRIISIDGVKLKTWAGLANTVRGSEGREMSFEIERTENGEAVTKSLKIAGEPESVEMALLNDSEAKKSFVIGIAPLFEDRQVGILDSLKFATLHVLFTCKLTLRSFGLLIKGAISPKHIGGPITIIKEAAGSAEKGLEKLLVFMIFLSISLAILNLLPIPILDGGHLVFFLVEFLKGGPVSLRMQEFANQVGLLLLLALMFFAVGNDIVRLFVESG